MSVLAIVILGAGLVGGVVLDRRVLATFAPLPTMPSGSSSSFGLMAEAWNAIDRSYVDRAAVKPRGMTYGAISGMVDALGDTGHSRFMSPELVKLSNQFMRGEFQGIGAELQLRGGHVVIVAPMDGSPAQKASLRPGDIIMQVDGKEVTGMPLDHVVGLISGPVGSSVTLTILRPDIGRTQTVTLQRASIEVKNVTWHRVPGTSIADLRIAGFSEGVTRDVQQALREIGEARVTGLILDLRDNPGGLLREAVGTASQFLRGGNVLLVRNAKGDVTPVPVESGGVAPDIRMVVLINRGTASGAEIVAGALQDARRAVLVGEPTFGTGTVLSQFFLSDGSALLLAVEEWLTPEGHAIWHKGVTPDLEVPMSPEAMPVFPGGEEGMTPAQVQASGDTQLLQALDQLTGVAQTPVP